MIENRDMQKEDLEDIFDLLSFRSLNPWDAPLDSISKDSIGRYVFGVNDKDVVYGYITEYIPSKDAFVLGGVAEVYAESCVLVN